MILVTILGDFHSSFLPINFEFKTKITKHVFVHDDSKYDLKYIKKVLNGQRDFLDEYSIFSNVEYEIVTLKVDEDSYESIIKCYDEITTLAKNQNDIYLNATDGLNSISIVLVSKFLKQGANIIVYDRYSNTYNLHTKNSMKKYDIKYNLDIKNHSVVLLGRILQELIISFLKINFSKLFTHGFDIFLIPLFLKKSEISDSLSSGKLESKR